ncbi:MAG: recombinase family protein, partial [Tannerella sp.]|nr:recombinase family protein [Tannerella sp.]
MNKNVILYSRVSSDEQSLGGSLDFQEQSLRTYCQIKGYTVVGIPYREDFSAKNFNRPEIQEIMKFCQKNKGKVDAILFTRWDRYSRNLEYALTNIRYFSDLGIEVNSMENPLDLSIPENKTLLAIYLILPEIDNDKRSEATRDGIIQALREGRCSNKAPRGYINRNTGKYNKWVEIDEAKAKYIRQIFNEVAKGVETVSYIRRQFARKGFDVPESSFLEMLRNRFYIGKVYVPAYKGTKAEYVKGVHQPMIDEHVFWKVQDVLDGKKKKTPKLSRKIHPDAFLRKYLKCPVCGSSMTGAQSRGNGGTYFYYNCSKDGKHFRCRADDAIGKFVNFTGGLKPNKEVLNLYNAILCDLKRERDVEKKNEATTLNTALSKIEVRMNNLQDKFMDGEITKDAFNDMQERYRKEMSELQSKIELYETPDRSNLEPKLKYSISLINNMNIYMRDGKVEVKCKLLSSMFPEKITYDGKSYRTNSCNSVL